MFKYAQSLLVNSRLDLKPHSVTTSVVFWKWLWIFSSIIIVCWTKCCQSRM